MNKNLHTKWILDDRKERRFVDDANQTISKIITMLLKGELLCENMLEQENLMYYLKKEGFPMSKETLDLFTSISPHIFSEFLHQYKCGHFGNSYENSESDITYFHKVNTPLIRMMDYFLEKGALRQLDLVAERLEEELLVLWFELTSDRIYKIIEENIQNPNLLFIFGRIRNENFQKFFKKKYLCIMQNAPFEAFEAILKNGVVLKEYIDNPFFLKAFKGFCLLEQIILSELLEKCEASSEFIKKLHKLFNKDAKITEENISMNVFEMSSGKLENLKEIIENSSYFTKTDVKNSKLWILLKSGYDSNIDLSVDYYSQIMNLYYKCREYATKSIVNALYPLNTLSEKVSCLKGKFNILARVRTMHELNDLDETFRIRTFCSFSVLTEKNMSHYGNNVLYGYYTGITPDSIAHIYPIDSLSNAGAKFESQLTNRMNMLMDIDDLNDATLKQKTYNQLCVRTKNNGKILKPDCIVCIDEVDSLSKIIADKMNLPIIILNKMPDTIENNEDIYGDLQ